MSFDSCMINLSLTEKIPPRELRESAKEYEATGMPADQAMIRAVEDRIELAKMDERRIVKAVREAFEQQGGKPKKPKAAPKFSVKSKSAARAAVAKKMGYSATKENAPWLGPDKWQINDSTGEGVGMGTGQTADEAMEDWVEYQSRFDEKPAAPRAAPKNKPAPATKAKPASQAAPAFAPATGTSAPDTPAFKRWFGRSKVVNKDGTPRKVFHGTTADIADGVMRPGEQDHDAGIFFTSSASIAGSVYAGGRAKLDLTELDAKLRTIDGFEDTEDPSPAVLQWARDMRNANRSFDWDAEEYDVSFADQVIDYLQARDEDDRRDIAESVGEAMGVNVTAPADGANVLAAFLSLQNPLEIDGSNESFEPVTQAEWIAQARAEGRDGLIITNYEDGGFGGLDSYRSAGRHTVYIAFEPGQVKSATGNNGDFDGANPDMRLSQNEQGAQEQGGMSIGDVAAQLGGSTHGEAVNALLDAGLLRIHQTADTLPEAAGMVPAGVSGLTMPDGTIHLIASELTPETAMGVFLHEVFHQGGEALLGGKKWNTLMERMGLLHQQAQAGKGEASALFDKARRRVNAAAEQGAAPDALTKEEFAAYAIEEYERAPASLGASLGKWVQDFIGAVKAWALVRFGAQLGDITPAQLSGLARLALAEQGMTLTGNREQVAYSGPNGIERRTRTIEVDGARRPITNSKGQQVGQGFAEQLAFWRWAGDTKVVDEQGRPLVVYHGTNADFNQFEDDKIGSSWDAGKLGKGFYFSTDSRLAGSYATNAKAKTRQDAPQIMPVYLSIQNPLKIGPLDWRAGENLWAKLRDFSEQAGIDIDPVSDPDSNQPNPAWSGPFREALQRFGHDGVMLNFSDGHMELVAFDPEQIKSATGNAGTFDGSNPDIRYSVRAQPAPTWMMAPETRLDNVIHTLQDKHIDMKRAIEAITKEAGVLDDKWNPYLQEELFHGRAATGFKTFLNDELRPLLNEMHTQGVTMEDLETFLHMRHAPEANAALAKINPGQPDGLAGVTTKEANDYMAALPAAQRRAFEALADHIDVAILETQRLLVDYGLEKQETIDAWNAAYQHYVPLHREDMDTLMSGAGTGQGFSVRGSASRRRVGSTREVVDIVANIAMARERAIVRGEKNRLDVALYGLALQAPNPEFWRPINPAKNPAALQEELEKMGLDPAAAAAMVAEPKEKVIDKRTGLVVKRANPMLRSAANVVAVRIDGEDRFIFFNERDERAMRMAKSLKNMLGDDLGRFLSGTAAITRYFAAINTQYNPIFGIVNLTRDISEGSVNLSTTPLAGKQAAFIAETGRLFAQAMRKGFRLDSLTGADAAMWKEFQKEGGVTGHRAMFTTSEERTADLQKELKLLAAGKTVKAGHAIFDWLSDYNEALENITRMAAYKLAKEQGMSIEQAASLAKNLTVNFNRKGAVSQQVGALYAFFNAAAQGIARMTRTLSSPGGKKIIGGGLLLGVVQATMLAMAGFDDKEPPEFVKAKNFLIPLGDKKYISIPMPHGYSYIPTVGRLGTELAMRGGKNAGRTIGDMAHALLSAFNPLGVSTPLQMAAPTIADPFAALSENEDHSGKTIYKEDRSSLDPTPGFTRAKSTASGVGKVLAEGFNMVTGGTKYTPGMFSPTPDQIDYLIGQFTGGVGRETLKLQQTLSALYTGEDLPAHKVPLAGRFYGDAGSKSSASERFYNNLRDINIAVSEMEGRREAREPYKDYLAEHPEARFGSDARAVERQLSVLRKRKERLIENGADRARVKEVELQMQRRMQLFNERVEVRKKKAAAAAVD